QLSQSLPTLPFCSFNVTAPTATYTLSLHDALPISLDAARRANAADEKVDVLGVADLVILSTPVDVAVQLLGTRHAARGTITSARSEEHTSELQSRFDLVCRLLLEKKKGSSVLLRD